MKLSFKSFTAVFRTCPHSPKCPDCEANFSQNKAEAAPRAKIRRCTVCTSRILRLHRTIIVVQMRRQIFRQNVQKLCRHTHVCQGISVQYGEKYASKCTAKAKPLIVRCCLNEVMRKICRKTSIERLCGYVLICLLSAAAFSLRAFADAEATEAENIAAGIISYNEKCSGVSSVEEWLEGTLTENAGGSSEWYIIALRQAAPGLNYSGYADMLEKYLSENKVVSATSRQKYALALIAAGRSDSEYIRATMNDSIGELGIMSYVYGLHLMNNGFSSDVITKEEVIDKLLGLQLKDGGWAISGENSDVDVTALTVQSLAPLTVSDKTAAEAVERAMAFLSEKQQPDGGYKSYGTENSESTSQVILALVSLGIDPAEDERFIKNGNSLIDGLLGYRLPDGSFSHTKDGGYNGLATVQAFSAAVSLMTGKPLYIFTDETANEEKTGILQTMPENTEEKASEDNVSADYKTVFLMVIGGAAIVVMAAFFLTGKRRIGNYIFVTAVSAVLCVIVIFTDISLPEDYYNENDIPLENAAGTVSISITCHTLSGKSGEYIPSDGIILEASDIAFAENATVYDVLVSAARANEIRLDVSNNTAHGMAYVSGIQYLYEFDYGELSGWMYFVNGEMPSVGCGEYRVSDGDHIEWKYTCNSGEDLRG